MDNKGIERIGTFGYNSNGSRMVVEEYINALNIRVRFIESNYKTNASWLNFIKGTIRNVYDKTVFGVGYLGEGNYKTKENNKMTKVYNTWKEMLKRCYDENSRKKYKTYKDCTVAEEWHNFQNFAKWYDENYYEIDNEEMCLDKDILINGNRIYSPEACLFVPKSINSLFVDHNKQIGDIPRGVHFHKPTRKYIAKCCNGKGKPIHIGLYDNPEEAFNGYKEFKKKVIKTMADEYKRKIPLSLYSLMINYRI
jgi:hypothetical protein